MRIKLLLPILTGSSVQAEVGARNLNSGPAVVNDPVLSASAVAVEAEYLV